MSRHARCFAILLALPLAACGAGRAAEEVPMLAPLVASGELPPLAERLPETPAVIASADRDAVYGGTLHMLDMDARAWSLNLLRQAGLLRYDQLGIGLEPDLAAGYRLSPDLRSLELTLRAGHKWSDGQPFTSDDIRFWWEAYANHPAFDPDPFYHFASGAMQLEVVDAQTVRFVFPEPYPVLLDRWGRALLATDGLRGPILPRHYLERFHADYNPEAKALAEAEGLDSWQALFEKHADASVGLDPERPSLWMWVAEASPDETLRLVRNPYFHQVDARGRQLPYIDRVEGRVVAEREALVAEAAAGGADFEGFYVGAIDLPLLAEPAAGHALRLAQSLETSLFTIHFNLNARDATLRELFGWHDFRQALSLAINRERIADQVFEGHARPSPALPLPQHAFYDPAWTEPLIRHDPEAASALLDALGLDTRDASGFRLNPDGARIELQMQMHNDGQQNRAICELVVEDWKIVGVLAQCRGTTVPQLMQWQVENKNQLPVWATSRTTRLLRTDPRWFGFTDPSQQWWAPDWTAWLASSGAQGERPPDAIAALAEQFQRWQALPYEAPEATQLAREYFGWFAENYPMIGTVGLQDQPLVLSERLQGLPEGELHWAADTNFYTPLLPAAWWLDPEPER
ncbi:MAG: hypothetical protein H6648_09555 [Caldilineae bacterium]|nr:hypothetical protein [Chloroflexota bacterium]MCB9177393.1 hypothetical protein [Caldilineae bacterium]